MSLINYKVEAFWDSEAEVWVATSDDVSGLVTEAENIKILREKIRVMIPELLSLNGIINQEQDGKIQWELITHRLELHPPILLTSGTGFLLGVGLRIP